MTKKGLGQTWLAMALCAVLATPMTWAGDDLQGGGRPRNGGGSSSGGTRGGSGGGGGRQDSPPPRRNEGGSGGTRQDSPPPRRNEGGSGGTRQDSPPPRRNEGGGRQDVPPPARRNEGGDTGNRQTTPGTRQGGSNTSRDRDRVRQGGSDGLQTGRNSRSGTPNYGSNNNGAALRGSSGRDNNGRSSVPSRERWTFPSDNEISRRARRDSDTRSVRVRSGYYHYSPTWRDNDFCYPYYAFTWSDRAVCSPWYVYPHLPGYLISIRINWNVGRDDYRCEDEYYWRYSDRYDYNSYSYALDNSVRDIVDLFENGDERALERLVPDRGDITIRNQNQRPYNISASDFYDLLADAAFDTRTEDYRIVRVQRGRGAAVVTAQHDYTDPWGSRQQVYHRYTLRERYGRYEIVEFATSDRRW